MKLDELNVAQVQRDFKQGKIAPPVLTQSYLDQIEKNDDKWGAYLSVFSKKARQQAQESDVEQTGSLQGIPIAVKDNILVEGEKCTAGSQILKNYFAPYNATVIEKLEEAGTVFLGKTNLDEFAMGSSTENSSFQLTRNPRDEERVPGGSSGGSAAAVASGEALCALGSDTGGSIRQPASFCGLVGFKPSYGAVSRYGLIAFGSSLDQIGPLTHTVRGAHLIFNIIKGRDENDATSREIKDNQWKDISWEEITIGVPQQYFQEGVDEVVQEKVKEAIHQVKQAGAQVKDVNLEYTEYGLPAYYIIAPSEASSNLARYDGIRYGYSEPASNLKEFYLKTRGRGFGPEVQKRIMLGTYSLSAGYYEAYYKKAQKVRELIKEDFEKTFEKVDVLFTPTTPNLPFKIGAKKEPLEMYMTDLLTVPASLAGLPALSLPVGTVNNLPVGLQIIGPDSSDHLVLEVGQKVEKLL